MRAFCAAQRVTEPSFYAWRRALAERGAAAGESAAATASAPAFVAVRLTEEAHATGSVIEVMLAGGRCIRVRGPVDRATLAEVVAALESVAPTSPVAS